MKFETTHDLVSGQSEVVAIHSWRPADRTARPILCFSSSIAVRTAT
jgi:hypothetical protein